MLLTLTLLSLLHLAPAADSLSGAWQIRGDIVGNPLNQVCTFKQSGTDLAGSCTSDGGPAVEIKGEVKEGKVTFGYASDYEGQAISITYSGALVSATELKGTIEVQPFGVGGEFTAAPVPAKP
jgi:hypothetical protein